MGQASWNDQAAIQRLCEYLWESASRAFCGIPLAFQKVEEVVGGSFGAVVEFIPDYEQAAAACSDIDPVVDRIKADLAGQKGRDAIQVRLQSTSGARSEYYITMYLDKALQRIDRPRLLQKLKGGFLGDRELRANVILDERKSSSEAIPYFLERAGQEPVNLWLDTNRARRLMHFNQHRQSKHAWIGRSRSVKAVRPLPFDELYQLCEKNLPELFYIRGYTFSRNLQKYSSSGNEFEAGEQGKETDFVRISYVAIVNNAEATDVASDLVCAVDGLPDFHRIIRDIKRTAEAVISDDAREIQRLDLPPNAGPRMVPLETTAPPEGTAREGSRPNDQVSIGLHRDLLSPPHIFTTGGVRRSRAIYWSANQPPEDIKAQMIVALIQLRLLDDPSPFVGWLERYVLQQFKIMAPSDLRKTVAIDAVTKILSHHGLTEDFKSWRKYVHLCLARVSRDLASFAVEPEDVPDPRSDASREESLDEGAGPVGSWSVADIARTLGISRQSTNKLIRKLVRDGKLIPLQKTPLRISETHVDILLAGRKERNREQKSRLRRRKQLEQRGKSFEAARKAINRKKGRLPSLF